MFDGGFSSRSSVSSSIPIFLSRVSDTGRLSDLEIASRLSLSSEQRSRRSPDAGRARPADEAGDSRAAGAADAGRLASRRRAGRQLRRPVPSTCGASRVVVDPERYPTTIPACFRRFSARLLSSAYDSRGSRRGQPVECRLHVRQRGGWRVTMGLPASTAAARRVTLPNHDERGGLLGQGALLTTTSYPTGRRPCRAEVLLNNIFGRPAPRRRESIPTSRTSLARRRKRCASGWRSIVRTRRAAAVTRSSTRSGSRSRIST